MIFLLAYVLVWAVVGWFCARSCYCRNGYKPGEFRDHHLPSALLVWFLHGFVWPLWVLLFGGFVIYDALACSAGRRVGDRLFGCKSAGKKVDKPPHVY